MGNNKKKSKMYQINSPAISTNGVKIYFHLDL